MHMCPRSLCKCWLQPETFSNIRGKPGLVSSASGSMWVSLHSSTLHWVNRLFASINEQIVWKVHGGQLNPLSSPHWHAPPFLSSVPQYHKHPCEIIFSPLSQKYNRTLQKHLSLSKSSPIMSHSSSPVHAFQVLTLIMKCILVFLLVACQFLVHSFVWNSVTT